MPTAEKCLHSIDAFCFSHTVPLASGLEVCKNFGEDRTGTAEPDLPKGYSIAHDVLLSNNSWGKEGGAGDFGEMLFVFPSNLYV